MSLDGGLQRRLKPLRSLRAAHPLAEMTAKLDRTDESLRTFDAHLAEFSRTRQPVKVAMSVNFQTGWHTAYLRDHESLPPRFAVLIGEPLPRTDRFWSTLCGARQGAGMAARGTCGSRS
jgi:hypothetical protein